MVLSISSSAQQAGFIRFLNQSHKGYASAAWKLASGLKINSAADDPAGLVISEQLRTRIASLNQEIENTSNLIHKYETGSSQVMELRSQLTEMRSLAIGAANEGFNSEAAQTAYDTQASYIVDRFNSAAGAAEFNGSKLLDGSEGSLGSVSTLEGVDLSTAASAQESIEVIDAAIAELDSIQVEIGATQKNELESRRSSLQITSENLIAAESQLRDTDYARQYSNMVMNMIKMQTSMALMSIDKTSSEGVLKLLSSK